MREKKKKKEKIQAGSKKGERGIHRKRCERNRDREREACARARAHTHKEREREREREREGNNQEIRERVMQKGTRKVRG